MDVRRIIELNSSNPSTDAKTDLLIQTAHSTSIFSLFPPVLLEADKDMVPSPPQKKDSDKGFKDGGPESESEEEEDEEMSMHDNGPDFDTPMLHFAPFLYLLNLPEFKKRWKEGPDKYIPEIGSKMSDPSTVHRKYYAFLRKVYPGLKELQPYGGKITPRELLKHVKEANNIIKGALLTIKSSKSDSDRSNWEAVAKIVYTFLGREVVKKNPDVENVFRDLIIYTLRVVTNKVEKKMESGSFSPAQQSSLTRHTSGLEEFVKDHPLNNPAKEGRKRKAGGQIVLGGHPVLFKKPKPEIKPKPLSEYQQAVMNAHLRRDGD